jgi:hypothetical protein
MMKGSVVGEGWRAATKDRPVLVFGEGNSAVPSRAARGDVVARACGML